MYSWHTKHVQVCKLSWRSIGCKQRYNKFNIQRVKGWVSRKIISDREGCKGEDKMTK